MRLVTGNPIRKSPFIDRLLAVFIIAYRPVSAACAAKAVNINTRSIEALTDELVGFCPELEKRIVDVREHDGKFNSLGRWVTFTVLVRVCSLKTTKRY